MTLISRLVFFKEKKKTLEKSSGIMRSDEISIVIPVKDNQQGIDNYLENFLLTHKSCMYPKEIIIVDNNSDPGVRVSDRHLSSGLIRVLKCEKPGPAAARNLGANAALGKWVLFNDSDCIPTCSLLAGYLIAANGSLAYAGNVNSLGKGKLSKYYESQEILIPLKTYIDKGDFAPQYLITANALIWRESFIDVSGFNETIKIAGGEDIDLGLRLSQLGQLSYAFESIILHNFSDGLLGFYRRFKRYGKGNRIVEQLWQTSMKPEPFRPNERTIWNEVFAKLQYLFLLYGYRKADKEIRYSVIAIEYDC